MLSFWTETDGQTLQLRADLSREELKASRARAVERRIGKFLTTVER